ncbi:MAG: MoxR family ATPase [Acidimicrobiia bacterium]|nr:MoxR family ATPase [Acidimicrobiia bacterium]
MMRTDARPGADLTEAHELAGALRHALNQVLRGKPEPVRLATVALLSGGHLLVDDVPGVGKTLLAKTIARAAGGSFRRVQATPDLLPSELTGVSIFHLAGNEWEFRPGPLFANVVLVDELNRATPRTQSALLEAMEEHQITVDGITRPLPDPFFLVATQNPFETAGTFPLVEGQLDRFTIVTEIGAPDAGTERELLLGAGGDAALNELEPVTDPVQLAAAIAAVRTTHCAPEVADYTVAIANATRANGNIAIGASPRASLALLHAAQAHAVLEGRTYVVPDDIARLAVPVLAHRLVLRDPGRLEEARALMHSVLQTVPIPRP